MQSDRQLPQLTIQILLLGRQLPRNLHLHDDNLRASVAAVQTIESFLGQFDLVSVLSASRDLYLLALPVDSRNCDLTSQNRIDHWDLTLGDGVDAFTFDCGTWLDCYLDDQVSPDMSFALELERGVIVDTSWELDFLLSSDGFDSFT